MKQTNLTRNHSEAVSRGLVAATAARSYSWVEELANDSGTNVTEGAVVVVLADGTIELASVVNDPRPTGVALDDIDDGESGQVCFGGPVDLVQVVASVTAGQYGATSTTPGEAQVTTASNALCWFTSSGTSPSAFVFPDRNGRGATINSEYPAGVFPWSYAQADGGLAGDGVNLTDIATTATSTTLTSASAPFVPGDVGKVIHVMGAGASGIDFTTTIAAFVSATQVTLTAAASTTVTGGFGYFGTDDSSAFQAWITSVTASGTRSGWFFFEEGIYIINGPLQDTGARNGQILLPNVSISDTSITLTFSGPTPPVFNAWGPMPHPSGAAVLKSTLISGSGTASVISGGVTAGDSDRNNISVWVENLTCIGSNNPQLTFWSLISTQSGGYRNLRIIGGGLGTEPTHSNAYGIKLPGWADSNYTPVDGVEVLFYYTGIKAGEMNYINAVAGYCIVGLELDTTEHATTIVSLQVTGCQIGIKPINDVFGDCYLYDAEHVTSPAWAVTTYDVDDASNHWYGHLRWWGVAYGGTPDHSFTVNGATNLLYEEIGAVPGGAAPSNVNYLVGTASGALSAEIAVGTTPGGELGGTWASPTVDATHAGSTHIALSSATPLVESGSGSAGTGTSASKDDHVHPAAGGASPGLVLLEQHTASSSATLNFTTAISATYDEYQIEFVNVIPANNAAVLWMRMSTDGGSTYDTSAIYDYTSGYAYSGGVGVGSSATNSTKILLMDGVSNSANYGVSGHIRLLSPGSTGVHKIVIGLLVRWDSGGLGLVSLTLMGAYKSTTAVNAVRFLMDTGNISSGIIRIYGLAK